MRLNRLVLVSGTILCFSIMVVPDTRSEELAFSAKVDKTEIDVGSPVTLTLTLTGDISGVEFPEVELPEGLAVAARSQSTNFSIRAGAMERSASLACVVVPQRAGTFQVGPFTIRHRQKAFETETIEITVKKSALPPHFTPHGDRFTL